MIQFEYFEGSEFHSDCLSRRLERGSSLIDYLTRRVLPIIPADTQCRDAVSLQ